MAKPLSILFAASECAPFAKVGGLGDVVGALPRALKLLGHDVRVVLPWYDTIAATQKVRTIHHQAPLAVPLKNTELWCAVHEGRLPESDVPVYFLEHKEYFSRGYIYDPPDGFSGDNLLRYAFLSRGAIQLCRHLHWTPDVFHVHDWPTSLIPIYLNTVERGTPIGKSASILTIHNMAHQGYAPKDQLPLTHVPWAAYKQDGLESQGAVNLLKGGLYNSTMLTTVSPSYAHEIRTKDGGFGLDGVASFRGGDLVGILNGIDDDVWNPSTDPYLSAHYSHQDLRGKEVCKTELQKELGLDVRLDVPLIGVVSRLNDQKGTDVIAAALDGLINTGAQIVVLGSGDHRTEEILTRRSRYGNGWFRAWIGFNERLAHRIEAGADMFLMPSRFEPCGLNQMYSQRYGTLPIVRATGGLNDTVENYNIHTGQGTGFKLYDLNVHSLVETVRWAVETWAKRKHHWKDMQVRSMLLPWGWRGSALKYTDVYQWSIERRRRHM